MRALGLALAVSAAALSSGCGAKLDPFLYTPHRTDHYDFKAEGSTPETTISPSQIEQVSIPVDDQVTLGGVYVRATTQPPRAYVIFFHGKGDHIGESHFDRVKRLANMGYDTLGFDYRGFGMSTDVAPTEAGVELDTAAVRRWMIARIGSDARLVYVAHSFGTAAATQRAEIDPPKVLILESPFASLEEFKTDSTQMDFPGAYITQDNWGTSSRIGNIHVPVMFVHGKQDDFVRPEFSQVLYDRANDPKRIVLVEGAHHSDIPDVLGGSAYAALISGWIDDHLP